MRERDDDNFGDLPEAATLGETCLRVWQEKQPTRFKASTSDEIDQLCGVALEEKNTVLIIDGIWDCLKPPVPKKNVQEIVRAGRHYNLDLHGTSQGLGDFAKVAKSCALEVYQFLETDADDLAQLEKRFGMNPEEVKSLPARSYVFWSRAMIWKQNLALQRKKLKTPPPAPPSRKSRA
jgi:hypothetical protein